MRIGSAFAGIGGFDLGFARAGWKIAWHSEIEPSANRVLAHHWPDVPNLGDITAITDTPEVDLISGGFPCQDVSVAGRREGLKGERSGLFFEFARIAIITHPEWIIVENVPGLLSSNGGRDFQTVIETLADIGYEDIAWRVVNSLGFGVPQRRRRVFIVGCLGAGSRAREVLLEPEGSEWHPPPRESTGPEAAGAAPGGARGDHPDVSHALCASRGQCNDPNEQTFIPVAAYALTASDGHHGHSSPRGDGTDNLVPVPASTVSTLQQSGGARGWRLDAEGAAGGQLVAYRKAQKAHHPEDCERWEETEVTDTLSAHGTTSATTVTVNARVRRLTPTECERLQGFPDGWTLPAGSDSARYRALGNAVTVPVARWLAERIKEKL